jgi:hypothetical protein
MNRQVSPILAIGAAVVFTGVSTWLFRIALAARRNKRLPAIRMHESQPIPAQSPGARVQHPADASASSQPTA